MAPVRRNRYGITKWGVSLNTGILFRALLRGAKMVCTNGLASAMSMDWWTEKFSHGKKFQKSRFSPLSKPFDLNSSGCSSSRGDVEKWNLFIVPMDDQSFRGPRIANFLYYSNCSIQISPAFFPLYRDAKKWSLFIRPKAWQLLEAQTWNAHRSPT
jgi:hypothetical protein